MPTPRDDVILTTLLARIGTLDASAAAPSLIALDGRAGSGKSTLAATVGEVLAGCEVIDGDLFYAGGSADHWDTLSPDDKAAHAIDWRRQRPVLAALANGEPASWHAYDWDAFDGSLEADATVCRPAALVILEGVYSARPELADLVDLRVLLDTDPEVCRRRLALREGDAYQDEWFGRWDEAEVYYFEQVMPPEAFDLVL